MYNFSENEIKVLLKNLVIMVDTREQKNQHIIDYFDKAHVKYERTKLKSGDYSAYIYNTDEVKEILGFDRKLYFDDKIVIERKNGVDELVSSIKDRVRFREEFTRVKMSKARIKLVVEDKDGYEKSLKGQYRSEYNNKAFFASLKSFESEYNFDTTFIDKELTGIEIFTSLHYFIRQQLKEM